MAFRFTGLPFGPFEPLLALSDEELAGKGFRRVVADAKPGYPCRISLEDAEPGERVLLVNYAHQPAHSPFKAIGPIFVREVARTTFDARAVPPVLRGRMLSLRAYDKGGMMVDADVVEGNEVEPLIERLFANGEADYLHVHFARRGCYSCRVDRA